MYILTEKYSRYAEPSTGLQLEAVLDPTTRCYIGVAHVADDAESADAVRVAFKRLAGFEIIDDAAYAERMVPHLVATSVQQPQTGDPLTDEAAHIYLPEELAAMKQPQLKPIAARFGIQIVPGMTNQLVCAQIIDAQSVKMANDKADEEADALLDGPPAPPSSSTGGSGE